MPPNDEEEDASEGKASQCVWRYTVNTCRAFLSPWYEHGGMEPEDLQKSDGGLQKCNFG